jgi:hypothetical protein
MSTTTNALRTKNKLDTLITAARTNPDVIKERLTSIANGLREQERLINRLQQLGKRVEAVELELAN